MSEGIIGLPEVRESDLHMRPGAVVVSATAGEREGIFGFRGFDSSLCMPINSLNSPGSVDVVACARDLALLSAPASLSSPASAPASLAGVAHARSTPMHDAHNSWSDTVRVRGPTGTRRVKGGVSAPAEDLRPLDSAPHRTMLPEPQLAEQLVEVPVPVPSFDDWVRWEETYRATGFTWLGWLDWCLTASPRRYINSVPGPRRRP